MSKYRFSVRPDRTVWVLHLPSSKRLMGKGDPCYDKHFKKFLKEQKVYRILKHKINKHGITGDPVLLDANDSGFKFVQGDVAHLTNRITLLVQKLVDSYCAK